METTRQDSSTSTTRFIIKGEVASSGFVPLESTVIPLREERRCRRLWFFYHDIRAFSTSWLPPILFTIYRLVHFFYIFGWWIATLVIRSDEGPKWLIFITNLSFTLLVICFGLFSVFNVVYTIVWYTRPDYLVQFYPREDSPKQRIYSQDNIAFYVKILWFIYITACTMTFVVTVGYWTLVFDYTCISQSEFDALVNATSGSGLPDEDICFVLDGPAINSHLIILLLAVIDIFLSRVPYQLLHFFYPCVFTGIYIIFAVIYFAAGGTNEDGDPFIYGVLDYGGNTGIAVGLSIVLVVLPIPFYFILFLLAWLRDFLYQKCDFFYRDIRRGRANVKYDVNGTDGKNGVEKFEQVEQGSKVDPEVEITTL